MIIKIKNLLKILLLTIILFTSCQSEKKEVANPDIVMQFREYRLEGFFSRINEDTLSVYDCFLYDTTSHKLYSHGECIISNDSFPLPFGWFNFWNTEGKLTGKTQYVLRNDSVKFDINQNITFGLDTTDTIYQESFFLKHYIKYLNKDTVEIQLKYRGYKENESNFAFIAKTDIHDEFVFRAQKPNIKFKLPIKKFIGDSNIRILMVRTNDVENAPDMIDMQFIDYDIELK